MRRATDQGRRLFAGHCAGCHGPDARGGVGPDLGDGDWLYGAGAVGEIEQTIAYGIRSAHPKGWSLAEMPAYAEDRPGRRTTVPQLSADKLRDLVAFLRVKRGAPADPLAADRGHELFEKTAGCYDCHAPDARGDPAVGAPNLTDQVWLYGGADDQVLDSIAHGRAGRMPAFVGVLGAAEIRKVAIYIHSLSSRTTP